MWEQVSLLASVQSITSVLAHFMTIAYASIIFGILASKPNRDVSSSISLGTRNWWLIVLCKILLFFKFC
jgi:hypothetical protein